MVSSGHGWEREREGEEGRVICSIKLQLPHRGQSSGRRQEHEASFASMDNMFLICGAITVGLKPTAWESFVTVSTSGVPPEVWLAADVLVPDMISRFKLKTQAQFNPKIKHYPKTVMHWRCYFKCFCSKSLKSKNNLWDAAEMCGN